MAKYNGNIELIDGLKPKNGGTFPLMNAHDIQTDDDGLRLDDTLGHIYEHIDNTIIFTEQTLTESQQTQARKNIGALSAVEFAPDDKTEAMTQPVGKDADGKLWTAPGGVRFDAAQELTADQQAQARENIGAAVQPEVYEVGIGRQFESFTECLTALKDDDRNKIIDVYEGTYNILEELGGQAFLDGITSKQMWYDLCPIVPPNTTIVGHGRVEIKMELPESNGKLAPLNLMGSAILRNLRISCTNAFTCVRIDKRTGKNGNALWEIEDCVLSSPDIVFGGESGMCIRASLYDGTILRLKNTVCSCSAGILKGTALGIKNEASLCRLSPQVFIEDCAIEGSLDFYSETHSSVNPFTVVGVRIENSHLTNAVHKSCMWEASEGGFVDCFEVTYINTPHTTQTSNLQNIIPDVEYDNSSLKKSVLYTQQTLTEARQAQARANIGAADAGVVDALLADINALHPLTITAFSVSPSLAEKGSTVSAQSFAYSVNRAGAAVTLEGEAVSGGTAKRTDVLTEDRLYTLRAVLGDVAKEKTVKLSFVAPLYYGVGADSTPESATVLALTQVLSASRARSFTLSAGEGQYILYAQPVALGAPTFKVGGFEGGFTRLGEFNFTNASGHTEPYWLYCSDNAGLGETTVAVS